MIFHFEDTLFTARKKITPSATFECRACYKSHAGPKFSLVRRQSQQKIVKTIGFDENKPFCR